MWIMLKHLPIQLWLLLLKTIIINIPQNVIKANITASRNFSLSSLLLGTTIVFAPVLVTWTTALLGDTVASAAALLALRYPFLTSGDFSRITLISMIDGLFPSLLSISGLTGCYRLMPSFIAKKNPYLENNSVRTGTAVAICDTFAGMARIN